MTDSDINYASWIPAAGSILDGRYRVEGNLDRGGMGVVLRAVDDRLDRPVAIKMLSPKLSRNDTYRERFEREVELATRMSHPNVIQCYDYGLSPDGSLFLVMELLDGLELKQVIRNELRLSTGHAIELALQVLDGLGAAHAIDVVHRDLKPTNIYVIGDHRDREVVKLLDFGLAKSLSSEEVRLTKTGMICGTAAYVAPEVLVVEQPGKAGDVYAMGLVILEMLFGRRVYPSAQMAQTFMEQLVVPARIPRRIWDAPLGRILATALRKHPADRYADATEMYDALAAIVEQSEDFVLDAEEIPPHSSELPPELLDSLADGRYRTIDTLYKLPNPEPWDPDDDAVDDRMTLDIVLEDISRVDMDAAFDTIRVNDSSAAVESSDANTSKDTIAELDRPTTRYVAQTGSETAESFEDASGTEAPLLSPMLGPMFGLVAVAIVGVGALLLDSPGGEQTTTTPSRQTRTAPAQESVAETADSVEVDQATVTSATQSGVQRAEATAKRANGLAALPRAANGSGRTETEPSDLPKRDARPSRRRKSARSKSPRDPDRNARATSTPASSTIAPDEADRLVDKYIELP